jgi:hypothetical protein
MPKIKEICENLRIHSEMFAQSSKNNLADTSSKVDDPVRKILLRGSEIIRGAADLGLVENPTALGILVRQLLELFISLQWVISDSKRADRYIKFSLDELDRLAQINMNDGLLSIKLKEDGSDATDEFLLGRKKAQKGVSIEQQARESGLLHIYQVFYRFMSLDTHGKAETIVNPDERLELTLVQLQVVGAISQALGHIAIMWLLHRQKSSNEKIRELLGLK